MPINQKIFALTISISAFILIISLIRKNRLREEFSVLWFVTCATIFVLVIKYDWLTALTYLIGAKLQTTTLFIGSIIFLMLLSIQFSIILSKMSNQIKNLSQDNALLRSKIDEIDSFISQNRKSKNDN